MKRLYNSFGYFTLALIFQFLLINERDQIRRIYDPLFGAEVQFYVCAFVISSMIGIGHWLWSRPKVETINKKREAALDQYIARFEKFSRYSRTDEKHYADKLTPLKTSLQEFDREFDSTRDIFICQSHQAIVFRPDFPPLHTGNERSFRGRQPFAPPHFQWPTFTDSQGTEKQLDFLLQVDCAEIQLSAHLGSLPEKGVVYFFMEIGTEFQESPNFAVIFADDQGEQFSSIFSPVEPKADSAEKQSFKPIAIQIPENAFTKRINETGEILRIWPNDDVVRGQFIAAQGAEVKLNRITESDFTGQIGTLKRPFPDYPHDWRALQIASESALREFLDIRYESQPYFYTELDHEGKRAMLRQAAKEARSWCDMALLAPESGPVPPQVRDEFWQWLLRYGSISQKILPETVTASVEASLNRSTEAAARIPVEWMKRVHSSYALAVNVGDDDLYRFGSTKYLIHRNTRMLSAPTVYRGENYEKSKTHLLLLETTYGEHTTFRGDSAIYQFWITPENLKAKRFEKVELTTEA
jgi:uncharacterized protein YwqG